MKSRICKLSGLGLLCLSLAVPAALAEEAPNLLRGSPGNGNGNGGRGPDNRPPQQPQQSPPPQRAPQSRPDMQRPQPGWQQPQGQSERPRYYDQRPDRDAFDNQPRPGAIQPGQGSPLQDKPDTVRQTQSPLRGSYPDQRNINNGRHWEAGGPGQRYDDRRWPGSQGNGWGDGPRYRPGQVIDRFPGQNHRVPYRGQDYFFSDGYWYRPQGPRYVVVNPPQGVRVRYLPDYAERLWIGSSMFFLAAGTYYQWQDNAQEYVVVSPPVSAPQPIQTSNSYDVAAYPANGQTPQQIAQDRYECQRWAVEQSGFNPATATYAPAPEVVTIYRQSLANCYSSRGYSVN